MKKILRFSGVFFTVMIIGVSLAWSNVCLLAGEGGASSNCDSGEATNGLPVHSGKTVSKKGTPSLCNNVNVFASCYEAIGYMKSHEFDYVKRGAQTYYNENNCPEEEERGSNCYVPTCTKETAGNGLCKSFVNNKCWSSCDVCRFNMIGGSYYPYADYTIVKCPLVDGVDFLSRKMIHSSDKDAKNYRITKLSNIEPNGAWKEDGVWKCDEDALAATLTDCKTKARSAKMVRGFDETIADSSIDFLCVEGSRFSLNYTKDTANDFISKYGCPYDALICNEDKDYYRNANDCQNSSTSNGNPCHVVKAYKDYNESECWHSVKMCTDFGYREYIHGNDYITGTESLTCPEGSNTEKKPYLNKVTGEQVKLQDHMCYACECKENTSRVSECNDNIREIIEGYYKAEEVCQSYGYEMLATDVTQSNCVACPYNATFWRCNQ